MRITEFYPEKQGRPYSPPAVSFEGRGDGSSIGIPTYSIRGIHLAGEYSRTTKTDDYTAGDEMVILAEGNITITLPAAATNMSKVYYIKNVGTGTVTIEPDSSTELIDDELSLHLTLQGQYVMIICSGTKVVDSYWHILGGIYMGIEKILKQQLDLLEKIRQEVKESKLHLASKTGENFSSKDLE